MPVIWTANDIGGLGAPALRRMTMCLEVNVPNLAARVALARKRRGWSRAASRALRQAN